MFIKKLLIICLVNIWLLTSVHAQKFTWAKPIGSTVIGVGGSSTPTVEHTKFLCSDANRNLYAASHVCDSSLTADTFFRARSMGPNLYNTGSLLLTSYTCKGTMRWARLIESWGEVISYGLQYYAGSIYVAGRFGDTGVNCYRYVNGVPLMGHDSQFFFLARYDTLGNLRWMQFIGTNDQKYAAQPAANGKIYGLDDNSLAVDGHGKLHYFVYLKNGVKITSGLTAQTGTYDIQFDTSGTQLGAVRFGVDSTYYLYDHTPTSWRAKNSVCISKKSGKIYTVMNKMTQGSIYSLSEFRLCAFSPTGMLLWEDTLTRSSNPKAQARIRDAVYDEGNSIYVSGEGLFGQFSLNGVKSTYPGRAGQNLTAIIKVDTNGKPAWVYANEYYLNGTTAAGELANTTLLPNGNILAAGISAGTVSHFKDSVVYPSYTLGPFYTIVKPNGDFVKMGSSYYLKGSHPVSGNGPDNFSSACVDKAGNIYFGGAQFTDTLRFTGGTYNTKLNGPSNQDGFIARMGIDCSCNAFAHAAFTDSLINERLVYFTYTGSTEAIDSIVWYFGGGQKKKVTTGFTLPFSRSYTSGGAYSKDSVLVIVYSGCGVDSAYRYPPPVAVAGLSAMSSLQVYPNPTHTGTFKVVWESPKTIREAVLTLTDITGRQVLEQKLQPNASTIHEEIAIPQGAPGVYILELRAGNERIVRRVVME